MSLHGGAASGQNTIGPGQTGLAAVYNGSQKLTPWVLAIHGIRATVPVITVMGILPSNAPSTPRTSSR